MLMLCTIRRTILEIGTNYRTSIIVGSISLGIGTFLMFASLATYLIIRKYVAVGSTSTSSSNTSSTDDPAFPPGTKPIDKCLNEPRFKSACTPLYQDDIPFAAQDCTGDMFTLYKLDTPHNFVHGYCCRDYDGEKCKEI